MGDNQYYERMILDTMIDTDEFDDYNWDEVYGEGWTDSLVRMVDMIDRKQHREKRLFILWLNEF